MSTIISGIATIEAIEASALYKFTRCGRVSRTYHGYLSRIEAECFTKLMLGLLIVSLICRLSDEKCLNMAAEQLLHLLS